MKFIALGYTLIGMIAGIAFGPAAACPQVKTGLSERTDSHHAPGRSANARQRVVEVDS